MAERMRPGIEEAEQMAGIHPDRDSPAFADQMRAKVEGAKQRDDWRAWLGLRDG